MYIDSGNNTYRRASQGRVRWHRSELGVRRRPIESQSRCVVRMQRIIFF